MQAYKKLGRELVISREQILNFFKPKEGLCTFYYGKIRNGKTYAATADILELLRRGETVYANWQIEFKGFDERYDSFAVALVSLITGRKLYFEYGKNNFHFVDPSNLDVKQLSKLVNVHLFIDEGQWVLNSHVRFPDPEKQRLILENGHHCRSLNIISQRPSNVFKDMRSQVNIWYKCSKKVFGPFTFFIREEIQDMKEDMPDEEAVENRKVYFPDKRVFAAYNTHGMRAKDAFEPEKDFKVYEMTFLQRLRLVVGRWWARAALERVPPAMPSQKGLLNLKK